MLHQKSALAKHIAPLLAGKLGTATAAESIARSTAVCQTQLAALQDKLQAAEAAIAQWQAEMCSFEAARSLLSLSKATLQELQG